MRLLRDLAINLVLIVLLGVLAVLLLQGFVDAWDYDCTHPYAAPTLHHSQENQ